MKKFKIACMITESQFLTSDEKELLLLELIKIDDLSLLHEGKTGKILVGSAVLLSMLALYSKYIDHQQILDAEFRKCRELCLSKYASKIRKAEEDEKLEEYIYFKHLYEECRLVCSNQWWKRKDELKKKKKELKEKIKAERAKLRRKKFGV